MKIWTKGNWRHAEGVLSILLARRLSASDKIEFYELNDVGFEVYDDVEPRSNFNHPQWWLLGEKFTMAHLQHLENRTVIWKAESDGNVF